MNLKALGCSMSLKLNSLNSHLAIFQKIYVLLVKNKEIYSTKTQRKWNGGFGVVGGIGRPSTYCRLLLECWSAGCRIGRRNCDQYTKEKVLGASSRGRRRVIIQIFDFAVAISLTSNYKLTKCKIELIS